MAQQKCRLCGAIFVPRPGDPVLMDFCADCHSHKLRRATNLLLDRLAAVNACGFCGHSEKAHRYKGTRFVDGCTVMGCGCRNFVESDVIKESTDKMQ